MPMTISVDVEIESVETWPLEVYELTTQNRDLVIRYQSERRRIDQLARDDVMARINPPANEYSDAYRSLVRQIDAGLARHRIVGYHCTRLTSSEIAAILGSGLKVLSAELVRDRLDRCVAERQLTQSQREFLGHSKSLCDGLNNKIGTRSGLVWFCPKRSALTDSSGFYRLFRSWGGEALYWGHEENHAIYPVLARIGTPTIVKCAIPFRTGACVKTFAEHFLSQSVANEIDYAEPRASFDLHSKNDVPPSDVLDIVQFSDSRFEKLTRYSSWPECHGINVSD